MLQTVEKALRLCRKAGDNKVLLKGQVLTCPYCGKEVSAYLDSEEHAISKDQIEEWSNQQLNLFGSLPSRLPSTLFFPTCPDRLEMQPMRANV